jgi:hypothetical protein
VCRRTRRPSARCDERGDERSYAEHQRRNAEPDPRVGVTRVGPQYRWQVLAGDRQVDDAEYDQEYPEDQGNYDRNTEVAMHPATSLLLVVKAKPEFTPAHLGRADRGKTFLAPK